MKEQTPSSIGKVVGREIVEEMKASYIDYAMSVIVARALPDVRDGLKPVHRRILYAMYEDGLTHGAKYRKSATVVGSTLGRYHPHGDVAVYDSLVRMAQDFSMRYPLIDGQGNFGCFTKDTKVQLTDGRTLSFGELVREQEQGKHHWTFSFSQKDKKIEIAEIKRPRLTRKNAELVEVMLDNGEKIRCTPDHRFMLRSGIYREAKNLKPKDSLLAAYFNKEQIKVKSKHLHYLSVLQPFTGHYEMVHKLADEYNRGNGTAKEIKKSFILHHKDFNRWNNNPENIVRLTWEQHQNLHIEQVKNLWKERGDEFREKHRASLQKTFADPNIRKAMSLRSRELWKNPLYRAKYSPNHSQEMARKLWEDPTMKEFARKRFAKQREDKGFKENHAREVRLSNKRRMEENPAMMRLLTEKARIALRRRWQSPEYKKRVVKSKILGFISSLFVQHPSVTPEVYEQERLRRGNNGVAKFQNLQSFGEFHELVAEAQKYNHKVVSVRTLKGREDVYDITVNPWNNFLLAAGVFVHNSIDNDPAAAQRYTECRMSRIGEEMLNDIGKETVDFVDNYDATRKEPSVLPSPIPQLLLNGTLGIAVGMATNIPPHNMGELLDALLHLLENPRATTEDLFQFIKGPDFPTGGIIYNKQEIIAAYSQGKGPIVMRGKAEVVESEKLHQIVITEIPFEVNKSTLVEQFAQLVQDKKIDSIRDIRDESDKDGLRIVFDLQREAQPQKILNRLYKFSDLQKTFHLNMLALVDGIQPKVLALTEVLLYFLEHRRKVVERRTTYDLKKAKEREHILEGLYKCLAKIDEVIKIIKASQDREDALRNLIKRFRLTEIQTNAILDMRLAQLAKLERKKIEDELKEIQAKIKELSSILASPKRIDGVIKKEFAATKQAFADERKTKVHVQGVGEIAEEDLIPQEETIITLTQGGYIKRINPATYKLQKRGGKGIMGMKTVAEDIVEHFLYCQTHDSLMVFTDSGKVFQTPVYEIPEGTRVAKGRGLLNFIELSSQDKVLSLFAFGKKDTESGIKYLVMITKDGIVKKTPLEDFKNARKSGLIAMSLKKGDILRSVQKSTGEDELIITTRKGQSIHFREKDVRSMGRPAAGIHAIRLKKGDEVVGMDIVPNPKSEARNPKQAEDTRYKLQDTSYLFILMENGYGKRTDVKEYRIQTRGGSGIKTANVTAKTGNLVYARVLGGEEEDLIVISRKGQVIRTPIESIPKISRSTQGVRIMRLDEGDKVVSAACL